MRVLRLFCLDGTMEPSFSFELAVCWIIASSAIAQDTAFQSRQVTPAGEYTFGIEGPAVDQQGNLYVVNFGKPGTIGKLAAGASQSELFAVLPEGSVGNAIRFDREGRMFVADYKKHNIFLVSPRRQRRQNLFPFRRLQSAERHDDRGRRHDLRERSALEAARRADLADFEISRR